MVTSRTYPASSRPLTSATSDRGRAETRRKDPIASVLRRDLYETHRLIDGLHRRFPATAPTPASAGAHGVQRHRRAG